MAMTTLAAGESPARTVFPVKREDAFALVGRACSACSSMLNPCHHQRPPDFLGCLWIVEAGRFQFRNTVGLL